MEGRERAEEGSGAVTAAEAELDRVDRKLAVWGKELPELDLPTEGIVERIHAIHRYLSRAMNETLEQTEASYGEWQLLGALRYGGPPYRSSPGKLSESLGLSSGAMTNRLDRMEADGLVRRLPDPNDRRGVLIELTERGWRLWEQTVGVQAKKESLIADVLDETDKERLNDLLRRLLIAWERHAGPLPKGKHG